MSLRTEFQISQWNHFPLFSLNTKTLYWGPHLVRFPVIQVKDQPLNQITLKVGDYASCTFTGNTEFTSTFHRFLNNLERFASERSNPQEFKSAISAAKHLVDDAAEALKQVKDFKCEVTRLTNQLKLCARTASVQHLLNELAAMHKVAENMQFPEVLTDESLTAYLKKLTDTLQPMMQKLLSLKASGAQTPQRSDVNKAHEARPAAQKQPHSSSYVERKRTECQEAIRSAKRDWTTAFSDLVGQNADVDKHYRPLSEMRKGEWKILKGIASRGESQSDFLAIGLETQHRQTVDRALLSLLTKAVATAKQENKPLQGILHLLSNYLEKIAVKNSWKTTAEPVIEALEATHTLSAKRFLEKLSQAKEFFGKAGYTTIKTHYAVMTKKFEAMVEKYASMDDLEAYAKEWDAFTTEFELQNELLMVLKDADIALQTGLNKVAEALYEIDEEKIDYKQLTSLMAIADTLDSKSTLKNSQEIEAHIDKIVAYTKKANDFHQQLKATV